MTATTDWAQFAPRKFPIDIQIRPSGHSWFVTVQVGDMIVLAEVSKMRKASK